MGVSVFYFVSRALRVPDEDLGAEVAAQLRAEVGSVHVRVHGGEPAYLCLEASSTLPCRTGRGFVPADRAALGVEPRIARAEAAGAVRPVLVCLFLRGGADDGVGEEDVVAPEGGVADDGDAVEQAAAAADGHAGADEGNSRLFQGPCKVDVLAQEAIPGMDSFGKRTPEEEAELVEAAGRSASWPAWRQARR